MEEHRINDIVRFSMSELSLELARCMPCIYSGILYLDYALSIVVSRTGIDFVVL